MSEPKHTPGPWQVNGHSVYKAFGRIVACCDYQQTANGGSKLANAALIARAPSLLADNERLREALRECDKAFASWQVGQIPGRPENILALISKVRSALSATERSK